LDSGFSSTLKSCTGALESFGSKLTSGFNFGFLAGAGQQAFSAISNGISGLIGEINDSNAAWKTFEANMSILGKSGEEIASVKKDLQEFAQQTVYSSSDMASTYAQLASVGVDAADELVRGFCGLAAAAENPQQAMKTLSTQAVQMAAKPTVAWEDFKLMLEQSPAGMAAVAKAMGMTTAELVSSIQDGEVATDDFLATIAEVGTSNEFAEMATEAKTVGQAMDGLKETIGNKLTPTFDMFSQIGINAINSVSDALGGLDAEEIADKVAVAVITVRQFLGVMKDSFSGTGEAIKSALTAVGDALGISNMEFSKTDAMETFKSVCDSVADGIETVAGFIEDNADTIAKVLPYVA
jgi:tape measure domain-containing protein